MDEKVRKNGVTWTCWEKRIVEKKIGHWGMIGRLEWARDRGGSLFHRYMCLVKGDKGNMNLTSRREKAGVNRIKGLREKGTKKNCSQPLWVVKD